MRVVSLIENTGKRMDLQTEHGLSLYIETAGHKVLFDTGATDRFLENAGEAGGLILQRLIPWCSPTATMITRGASRFF